MSVEGQAQQRLDALVARASRCAGMDRSDEKFWPELAAVEAQSLTTVSSVAGRDSDYYSRVLAAFTGPIQGPYMARYAAAIVQALRDDVAAGYLRRTSDLIAAEVFGDFLDMAEHLLGHGYHHAAASLIGAVLEDGLRRLAQRNDVKIQPRDDIGALNSRLADSKVYSQILRKQVGVWADIRNKADHGEFDAVKIDDVRDMYSGVVRFMAEQLG